MKPLRIKINTGWCSVCQRMTAIQNGMCVLCTRRMANELGSSDGLFPKACSQCEWSGFIAPSGNEFICPNCGSKIGGVSCR